MNSMFLADIYSAEFPGPSHRIKKTVQVETTKVLLKENGVNLTLTVVDTPGFGDAVDNSNWLVVRVNDTDLEMQMMSSLLNQQHGW
jgi:septin 7